MDHVIEFDEACKSCKATGLYVGLAERDGAAVVCHTCKGTGKHHVKIEFDDFEGCQKRDGVVQVFEVNPGICIGANGKSPNLALYDFGGMSYRDWLKGKPFIRGMENRRFTCPAWWYQSANYELKPNWDECCGCGCFSGCKHFGNKAQCWERFDKEQQK
ncbi:MAG: hypothetical protein IMZ61_14060 [Planctomycetes bacterium]|nr:hypothetical protein [Planctomycetota bacterium]